MKITSTTKNKLHWLEYAEIFAVIGYMGGSITGVFFQQILWATAPLSVSAAFAVLNHQRLKSLIEEEQKALALLIEKNETKVHELKIEYDKNYQANKTSISKLEEELGQVRNLAVIKLAQLQQEEQADFKSTSQELEVLQNSVAKLDNLSQKLEQDLHTIDNKQEEISSTSET